MKIALLLNREAGSLRGLTPDETAKRIVDAVAPLGVVDEIAIVPGADLPGAVERLFADETIDLVVVAGGDGTMSLAAAHAFKSGKTLLPLPFGTFNLFCRALGWGGDPLAALDLIGGARTLDVDVGMVDGQVFVHHVSAGLHPHILTLRKVIPYNSRLGKMAAGLRALTRALWSARRRRLRISADGKVADRRTIGLAVTVNEIAELPGAGPVAEDPSGGQLAVYVATANGLTERIALVIDTFRGRWANNARLDVWRAHAVTIMAPGRRLRVSIDGELTRLKTPLHITIAAGGLKAIAAGLAK